MSSMVLGSAPKFGRGWGGEDLVQVGQTVRVLAQVVVDHPQVIPGGGAAEPWGGPGGVGVVVVGGSRDTVKVHQPPWIRPHT